MKTILVGTDFSAVSRNATVFAAHLASALGARLVLFHAYNLPTAVTDIAYMMVSVEEIQKENEERIKKDADRIFASFGVEVEWLVRIGIPSEEIKILADEKNADLVVMAIRGEGASNKFIGSTTVNTIQRSKKPVLVVPWPASFDEIHEIAYATDYSSPANTAQLDTLMEIIRSFGAKLHLMHVKNIGKEHGPHDAEAAATLDAIFKDTQHDFIIQEAESIMQGINEFTQSNPIQLLVMTLHKHNFFEKLFGKNYTREVAFETKVPLLVLRQSA
ncbi:MAG TPA: universal stress protein [Puia sp.]|nr:universal stress protein [Puia sp.]